MQKYYVVKKGRSTGIFLTWNECKEQIMGFKGAEYKSFKDLSEAENYLNTIEKTKMITSKLSENEVLAYIDGSYNKNDDIAGFGVVFVKNNEVIYKDKKSFCKHEFNIYRNIFGELKGAEEAIKIAIEKGYKTINIIYDYKGIENWATGEWKRNNRLTQEYRSNIDNYKKYIHINFIKVKAHASEDDGGDKFNEMADKLAKEAVGV